MEPPQPGDRLRVDQLEHSLLPVRPLDVPRAALLQILMKQISCIRQIFKIFQCLKKLICAYNSNLVLEQLEQELPQVCRRALPGLAL